MEDELIVKGAIELLKPVLGVAGTAAVEGGKKLWHWLKGKFTDPIQKLTLEEVEKSPDDPKKLRSLQFQITEALEDETFRKELLALLPKETRDHIEQNANQSGSGNQLAQTMGDGNSITFR